MVRKWAKFEEGFLKGWKKDKSDMARHRVLNKLVGEESYATVVRRLNQLRNVTKDKETKKVCEKDMKYLKERYR